MHKLIDYVCDELGELEDKVEMEGSLTMADIDLADKLAHLKKNLLKTEHMGDHSYARGRGKNAPRDSMGRYSRSDVRHDLNELMEKAQDTHTREEIRKLIERM